MSNTTLLDLPLLEAAQAQKHVTHNEALQVLDVLTMPAVADKDLATPPGAPAEGDRYIVAASATDDWAGQEASIAAYQDGIWRFFAPKAGWTVWVEDDAGFYVFDGMAWTASSSGGGGGGVTSTQLADGTITQVGVNAASDTTNKLSVNSDAALFNHNGSDSRVIVSKNTATDTASHLFQTDFSGRAEFGLTGSDDFQVKVSSDGNNWINAFTVDRTSGVVTFHQGMVGGSAGDSQALKTCRINQAHSWFYILSTNDLPITNVAQGFVDVFEDETGVDTATSTNETYDGTGEYYAPSAASSSTDGTSGLSDSGTNRGFGDGDANGAHAGLLFTASASAEVDSVELVLGGSNSGTFAVRFYENNSGNPGSAVGGYSDPLVITSSGTKTFSWSSDAPTLSSGTEYWCVFEDQVLNGSDILRPQTKVADAAFASGRNDTVANIGAGGFPNNELLLLTINYVAAASNMTLVSNAVTADAEPDTIDVVLQHEPVDSVTLNTDCTIEVSIDGGSTWAAGTLELISSNSGINILSADDIDVSGQTGTSVKYRFKTLNSKNQKLHAVALNWR